MPNLLIRIGKDTRAATAIEYGMILALVALAAVGAIGALANQTASMWNNVSVAVTAH